VQDQLLHGLAKVFHAGWLRFVPNHARMQPQAKKFVLKVLLKKCIKNAFRLQSQLKP
jgi:hypothetical protein